MLQLVDSGALLLVVHLIGLALGFGGALTLEFVTWRFFVRQPVERQAVDIVHYASRLVALGLGVLWLSGIALIANGYLDDGRFATDPKVWAKITIVSVLTLNGVLIHRVVMPTVRAQEGRLLFDGLGGGKTRTLLMAGAVSSLSWLFPLVFGCLGSMASVASFADGYAAFITPYVACVAVALLFVGVRGRRLVAVAKPPRAAPSPAAPARSATQAVPRG